MPDQQPVARSSMVPFLGAVALALFALNFFAFLHKHFHQVRHIICHHQMETVAPARAFTFEAQGLDVLTNRRIEHDVRMAEHAVRQAQRMMERDMARAEREIQRAERELQQALREMEQRERTAFELERFEVRTHDAECNRPSHNQHSAHRSHRTIVVRPHDSNQEKAVQFRVIR